MPLLLAVVSIIVALALAALIGQAFDLSVFIVNMLTGMGLALGIDYALFIVSRYREERAGGRQEPAAIVASGATASRAVLFSGMTFVLAMLGMVLVPDTILRSLALGAILVGAVSVVAALTLLPALLGLLGDRVNALRIPFLGRSAERGTAVEGRFWSAVSRAVIRRPVISLVVSVALLLGAAVPVLDLNIGFAGIRTFPDHLPSKQGFNAIQESSASVRPTPCRSLSTATSEVLRWQPPSTGLRGRCVMSRRSGSRASTNFRSAGLQLSRRSLPAIHVTSALSTQSSG